jgi:hypothetical protein
MYVIDTDLELWYISVVLKLVPIIHINLFINPLKQLKIWKLEITVWNYKIN